MRLDLDELERKAVTATLRDPRVIEEDGGGFTVGFAHDHYVGYLPKADAELVAATDPEMMLDLIAVARAAKAIVDRLRATDGYTTLGSIYDEDFNEAVYAVRDKLG